MASAVSMGECCRCVCSAVFNLSVYVTHGRLVEYIKRHKHKPACGIYVIYNGPFEAINWNHFVVNLCLLVVQQHRAHMK